MAGYLDTALPSSITENNTVGVTNAPSNISTNTNAAYVNSFNVSESISTPAGSATPVLVSSSVTTTDKDMVVNFMYFAVGSQNINGTTGSATNVYFQLVVNGISIFQGSLPQECGDAKDVIMNNLIDVTDFFLPKGSTMLVKLGAATTGGNGYRSFFNFGFTGISLK